MLRAAWRGGRSRQALQNLQVLWDLHGAAAACTVVALRRRRRRRRRRRTVALRARAGEGSWQRNAHRLGPELFVLFVRSAASACTLAPRRAKAAGTRAGETTTARHSDTHDGPGGALPASHLGSIAHALHSKLFKLGVVQRRESFTVDALLQRLAASAHRRWRQPRRFRRDGPGGRTPPDFRLASNAPFSSSRAGVNGYAPCPQPAREAAAGDLSERRDGGLEPDFGQPSCHETVRHRAAALPPRPVPCLPQRTGLFHNSCSTHDQHRNP